MKQNNIIKLRTMSIFLVFIILLVTNINAATWWDSSWEFRDQINISTGSNSPFNGYLNYTVQMNVNTTDDEYFLNSTNDLRIVYWDGTVNIELDREVIDNNSANSRIRFKLQDNISASSNDSNYYLYYSNPLAISPPINYSNVYLWYDDASTDRESQYTQGRVDNSAHGSRWRDSISWNAAGYYSYNTGDNFADSLRPTSLSERDVYFEYSEFQTAAYPGDMTSGPIVRWQGTGTGPSEDSSHFYFYEMGESLLLGGSYSSHDDITHDSRGNVAISYGVLGFFPTGSWTKLGISSWGVNPTNIKGYYENETGGFSGSRFSGTHASGVDNEGAGQVGLWVQQDGGIVDNIIARRYTEPEPDLNNYNNIKQNSELTIDILNASTSSINYVEKNNILNITARVYCSESFNNDCGNVSFESRYNDSSTTYTNIPTTTTSTPVWTSSNNPNTCLITGGSNCTISFLINITGDVNSAHNINIFSVSNNSDIKNITSDNIPVSISGNFVVSFNQTNYNFPVFIKNSGTKKVNITISSTIGDNTNISVSCESGDCSIITENWIQGISLNESQTKNIEFTCSDFSSGSYSAIYNLNSDEYNSTSQINLTCVVDKIFGPISGSIIYPIEGSILQVSQNKTITLNANMTCVGTCGNVSALLVLQRGKTGLTSLDPGDSGWQIKQDYPYSQTGVYWIQTQAMTLAQEIYVDMDYDNGGWMLIGRGREGWSFSDSQQGTFNDIASIPDGVPAFSVDHYSASFVDELLNNTNINILNDGVRVKRASDTTGNTWQEGRWSFSTANNWDWDFDGNLPLSDYTINGVSYGSENTRDAQTSSTDKIRMTTISQSEHNNQAGFEYGNNECDGTNTPTNYQWEYTNECNAIPFTQVYINPHYRDKSIGKVIQVNNKPLYSLSSNSQSCTPTESGSCSFSWSLNVTGTLGSLNNLSIIYFSNYTQIANNQSGISTINISIEVEPTIILLTPIDNSKIIGENNIELKWYVDDESTTLNCSLYINNILNQTTSCTSATNTSIYLNLNNDTYTWKVQVNDNITKINSTIRNLFILDDYWAKITKRVYYLSSNLYQINLNIENKINSSYDIVPIDYVDINYNYGSFNLIYDWTNLINNNMYDGNILGWDVIFPSLSNQNFNYSITNNFQNNKVPNRYIIGLE